VLGPVPVPIPLEVPVDGATPGALGVTGRCATGALAGIAGRGAVGVTTAGAAAFTSAGFGAAAAGSSSPPANFLRTFSATSTGMELECVFFSVTP